ncbi:MAG: PEP-CTERM sorting domain-containing protein [Thiobacillus sp.]
MATRNTQLSTLAVALGLIGAVTAPAAQATDSRLNPLQVYPDIGVASPTIVYDNTGGSGGTGVLKLYSASTVLKEAAIGGTSSTQVYSSGPTEILTINVTGTGSFLSGSVSIPFDGTGAQFSWNGTITGFGFNDTAASGQIFDATWTVTSDSYTGLPVGLSQFVNGYMTGGTGGIHIGNGTVLFNDAATWANDWVMQQAPGSVSPTLTSGLSSPVLITAVVTTDVFATPVPEASTYGMMLAGLAVLVPMVRRKRSTSV